MPGSPGPAGSTHIQQRAREAGQEVLQPVNSAAQLLDFPRTGVPRIRSGACGFAAPANPLRVPTCGLGCGVTAVGRRVGPRVVGGRVGSPRWGWVCVHRCWGWLWIHWWLMGCGVTAVGEVVGPLVVGFAVEPLVAAGLRGHARGAAHGSTYKGTGVVPPWLELRGTTYTGLGMGPWNVTYAGRHVMLRYPHPTYTL